MATVDLGKIKFHWRGAFSNSNTYEADDVVSHAGSSWIYVNTTSKTGTNAGAPSNSNTTHWNLMADGTLPLTTAGDLLSHDGNNAIRVPVGNVGSAVKVTSANTLGFGTVGGFEGQDILSCNIPLYANSNNSTLGGTDGKYPWLARYNGKSGATEDWIPQDGMINGRCGPVKRDTEQMICSTTSLHWINSKHEPMTAGYQQPGLGSGTNTTQFEMSHHYAQLSMEFGGMAADEYFVRQWFNTHSTVLLTNKGNIWVGGENGSGQLGLGDTVDRYQLVRNPYFGPDATTNSVSMEVSCVATNDAKGYQGMGNTHYFCITHNGDVYAFGWGGSGSHGLGNTNNATTPTKISGLSNIVQISAGYNDTMFVDSNGNAYHTGSNTNSISSLGAARTSPAQMTAVTNCAQILCHNTYYYNGGVAAQAYYIDTSGNLYGIGYGSSGSLGQGNTNNQSAWVQIGGSENYAAIQVAGNATTASVVAWKGNPSGVDGPGDMYTYTIASRTGMSFNVFGYNGHGALMQGNTTANSAVLDPQTTTFGSNRLKTVTSSADGVIQTNNVLFPRNEMIACFPFRTSGYNAPGWWGLDKQGRLWIWGYMAAPYDYQANTSAVNFTNAYMYPSGNQHTLTGQSSWWLGSDDIKFEDIYSIGHYYSGYWTHFARFSDNSLWGIGNNYYYQHGTNTNTGFRFWHKINP
tara:strand:- start:1927 stop:3993 length:2067 start_codon:yes stop_codon:yes gene_type:complete